MKNMLKHISIGLTAWQLMRKRFGTVGSFLGAVVIVAGYVILLSWLRESYPGLAERLE